MSQLVSFLLHLPDRAAAVGHQNSGVSGRTVFSERGDPPHSFHPPGSHGGY